MHLRHGRNLVVCDSTVINVDTTSAQLGYHVRARSAPSRAFLLYASFTTLIRAASSFGQAPLQYGLMVKVTLTRTDHSTEIIYDDSEPDSDRES
jgi:hypothetical protein